MQDYPIRQLVPPDGTVMHIPLVVQKHPAMGHIYCIPIVNMLNKSCYYRQLLGRNIIGSQAGVGPTRSQCKSKNTLKLAGDAFIEGQASNTDGMTTPTYLPEG